MELTKSLTDVLVPVGFNKEKNRNLLEHQILFFRGVANVKLNW